MATANPEVPFTLDIPTALSLLLVFSFLPAAQLAAARLLPKSTPSHLYWLFIWCGFDVLTHSIVEGSYLYHCFFSYTDLPFSTSDHPHPASLGSSTSGIVPGPFLGHADRLYGAWYSTAPMARVWQEYAKADRRWGGADLNVISLELLTVFGDGPLAFYICVLVARLTNAVDAKVRARCEAKVWLLAIILSTAELYGGFMTFSPEWLSGNTLLRGDDVVYMWLYLFFFNMIWVVVPAWVLWVAWREIGQAFVRGAEKGSAMSKKVR